MKKYLAVLTFVYIRCYIYAHAVLIMRAILIIIIWTRVFYWQLKHIRDPSGVFSVCHAREWYIDKFPPFLLLFFFKIADEFKVCGVERRRHLSLLRTIRKC